MKTDTYVDRDTSVILHQVTVLPNLMGDDLDKTNIRVDLVNGLVHYFKIESRDLFWVNADLIAVPWLKDDSDMSAVFQGIRTSQQNLKECRENFRDSILENK